MTTEAPRYRPDIDGLRAVAVLAVVGFHYGVPGLGGGYVGVDLFFVISGYLITGLLVRGLDEGRFSLAVFYERRIRRIFPALFAVIAACFAIGCLLLLPPALEALGRSGLATLGFVSNVLFWSQTGYFDDPALTKPLLHTWSLAVEEQFYIVFPPLLWLLYTRARTRMAWGLAVLALLSLGLSVYQVGAAEEAAFFLPFGRAWEFIAGAWLVVSPWRNREWLLARQIAGFLAPVAILACVFVYDSHNDFPGHGALPPVLGALALIWSGERGHVVNRVLALRPLVAIGLVSYSLYLWHWPLLVFAELYLIVPITPLQTACVFAAALILSVASWRWVEQPFRRGGGGPGQGWFGRRGPGRVFAAAGGAAAALACAGVIFVASGGFYGRVDPGIARIAAASDTESETECFSLDIAASCRLGEGQGDPSFVLWGDSHARALVPGFDALARRAGLHGVAFGGTGCTPFPGIWIFERDNPCTARNEEIAQALAADPAIRTLVIAARWALYAEGSSYPPERPTTLRLRDSQTREAGVQENRAVLARGLARLTRRLTEAGKTVVLIGPVPEIGYDVPATEARIRFLGRDLSIEPKTADFLARQSAIMPILEQAAEEPGVFLVLPHEQLCGPQTCRVVSEGQAVYFDDDHLSPFGARLVVDAVAGDLLPRLDGGQVHETPGTSLEKPENAG